MLTYEIWTEFLGFRDGYMAVKTERSSWIVDSYKTLPILKQPISFGKQRISSILRPRKPPPFSTYWFFLPKCTLRRCSIPPFKYDNRVFSMRDFVVRYVPQPPGPIETENPYHCCTPNG